MKALLTGRQRLRSIEETNVVQTQEASLEDVVTACIFSVNPPGEVHEELLEDTLQETDVFASIHLSLNLEHSEGSPSMYRRVDIAVAVTPGPISFLGRKRSGRPALTSIRMQAEHHPASCTIL